LVWQWSGARGEGKKKMNGKGGDSEVVKSMLSAGKGGRQTRMVIVEEPRVKRDQNRRMMWIGGVVTWWVAITWTVAFLV